ncbi:MAG: hypothetical protein Q7J06_10855 [Bacteroidales bacterium]|nr:hypothetical protein [Bacteroidales bacterium]
MKAQIPYNDFEGSVAADISDGLGKVHGDNLESIGKYFNLDENRFKIVGISIYGTNEFSISLICIDLERSTDKKEHIVSMLCEVDDEKEILDILFKQLHIVLYDKFDVKYVNMDYDSEVRFSDYHDIKEKKEEE